MIGKRIGRLVVLEADRTSPHYLKWTCRCDCGTTKSIAGKSLRNGDTRSCGCLKREQSTKHGLSHLPEWTIWNLMKGRCLNPNDKRFARYGGRGIKICDRWLVNFGNFYADMGPRPSAKHSLDRYPDNDGNYELTNCRWATSTEQARNASFTKLDEAKVAQIRALDGIETRAAIALRFDTCPTNISSVLLGKTWR